jgi:hypothetical protein
MRTPPLFTTIVLIYYRNKLTAKSVLYHCSGTMVAAAITIILMRTRRRIDQRQIRRGVQGLQQTGASIYKCPL